MEPVCSPAPLQGARERKVPLEGLKQQAHLSRKCLQRATHFRSTCWKYSVNLLSFCWKQRLSHASILLFIYDAVVREIAQDTIGPCLIPSSAPKSMTPLSYRASELPNWGAVLYKGFFSIWNFLLGSKMLLPSDWVRAATGASVTLQLNGWRCGTESTEFGYWEAVYEVSSSSKEKP